MNNLKSYLAGVGVSDQTCLKCFTAKVATETVSYIQTSLLQHYSLFEYIYEEKQEDELIQTQVITNLTSLPLSFPSYDISMTIPFLLAFSLAPTRFLYPLSPSSWRSCHWRVLQSSGVSYFCPSLWRTLDSTHCITSRPISRRNSYSTYSTYTCILFISLFSRVLM